MEPEPTGRGRRRVRRQTAAALVAWLPAAVAACGDAAGDPPPANPTFAEDVAPIIHAECSRCHRPGGSTPFPLVTYEDVSEVADLVAEAVRTGRMPPWLLADADVEYLDDRRLPETDRRTIVRWVETGLAPGDLSTVVPPTFPDEWRLGPPQKVVRTLEPFPVPAAGGDIFRNLVIPSGAASRRWVRGMDLRFSDPAVVHHAMIALDESRSSRRADAREPGPGFDGMFGTSEAVGPSGFLLGWTHGHEPRLAPLDLAFPLEPGTDIVLQLHLRPNGTPTELGAEIAIYYADGPPDRTPFTIRLGAQEIDIPPGDPAYVQTDEYRIPVDLEILGLYPHAHYVGRSIELSATPPDSSTIEILDIPDWDFNWQDAYRLASPLRLPAGTRLDARFVYDNSADNPRNPHDPPRRVLYGPRSEDEMGEIWIQVVPVREEDLTTLATDFAREDLESKLAGWRHTLRVRPGDPPALAGLGTVAQARGDHEEAITRFREALETREDYVVARYNLAVSLELTGRTEEAVRQYRRVLEDDPTHPRANNNLGLFAASAGDLETAARRFETAVREDPTESEFHSNLGNVLRQLGQRERATEELLAAIERGPELMPARLNLSLVIWERAASPDPGIRAPGEAVRLAEIAASGPGAEDPRILDVLAAAYASAGRFDEAVAAARRALGQARALGERARQLAAGIQRRLDLYESGRPFILP